MHGAMRIGCSGKQACRRAARPPHRLLCARPASQRGAEEADFARKGWEGTRRSAVQRCTPSPLPSLPAAAPMWRPCGRLHPSLFHSSVERAGQQ